MMRSEVFHAETDFVGYRIPRHVEQIVSYSSGAAYPLCPRCRAALEHNYQKFCDKCGQRLDWNRICCAKIISR